MRLRTLFPFLLAFLFGSTAAIAATFVVPLDAELIRRSDAVVIGSALASYARETDRGGIETVTPFSVEEAIKGDLADPTIDVVEPGGVLRGRSTVIAGVPRFTEGKRLLLFLKKTGAAQWS